MKILKTTLIPPLLITMVACVHVTGETSPTVQVQEPVPIEEFVQAEEALFSQAELDQMLAPIALYPDVLLSQVLMASTYPLEVVEASRWSQSNSELTGDEAVQAVEGEGWDLSIQTLVGLPELLQLMDKNLSWTRQLGDAFLLQEEQVMETVQDLRSRALAEGTIDSLEHITVEQQEDSIVIEPVDVRVVYVPYYNTRYVYGNWWWNDYPPYYWGPSPVYYSSIGFHWSRGFHVSTSFYYSTCYWPTYRVVVSKPHHSHHRRDYDRVRDKHRYSNKTPTWKHDPSHRRGVQYRNEELNTRYERRTASHRIDAPVSSSNRRQDRQTETTRVTSTNRHSDVAQSNRIKGSPRPETQTAAPPKRITPTTRKGNVASNNKIKGTAPRTVTRTETRKPAQPRTITSTNRYSKVSPEKKTKRTTTRTNTGKSTQSRTIASTKRYTGGSNNNKIKGTPPATRESRPAKSGTVASKSSSSNRSTTANNNRSKPKDSSSKSSSSNNSSSSRSSTRSSESTQSSNTSYSSNNNTSYASHRQNRNSRESSNRAPSRPRDP